jgi:hypothetical protein
MTKTWEDAGLHGGGPRIRGDVRVVERIRGRGVVEAARTTICSSITISLWCSLRSLANGPSRLGTYSLMLGA